MFQMTTDVVTALKSVATWFAKDAIVKIEGENIYLAANQLTAGVESLVWMDALSGKNTHFY